MMLKEMEEEQEISSAPLPLEEFRNIAHDVETDSLGEQRIFKKTSPNSVLTLYLGTREIIARRGVVEPLKGVLYVDPKFVVGHRLFSQLTLTFRYGREDEEVMGLKFCNEAVIALKQIWPQTEKTNKELSPLQKALMERLGIGAHAFSIEISTIAPPSVQLIPAKHYNGAPIGTSYDIRAYIADQPDEKLQRRSTVKLGVRLIHKIPPEIRCSPQAPQIVPSLPKCLRLRLSPKALKFSNKLCGSSSSSTSSSGSSGGAKSRVDKKEKNLSEEETTVQTSNFEMSSSPETFEAPQGSIDKPFLWREGRVSLKASLNKTAYGHDEDVAVTIDVRNESRKIVRKIRIFAVQHVDVCMFSNGKFKNVVADVHISDHVGSGCVLHSTYFLLPIRAPTKNWIAVEGALFNSSGDTNMWNENSKIAPSSPQELQPNEDRNVFAIYVSYYVKVKLTLSGMGGELSLKLPFVLGHVDDVIDKDAIMEEKFSTMTTTMTTTTTITTTTTTTETITPVAAAAAITTPTMTPTKELTENETNSAYIIKIIKETDVSKSQEEEGEEEEEADLEEEEAVRNYENANMKKLENVTQVQVHSTSCLPNDLQS